MNNELKILLKQLSIVIHNYYIYICIWYMILYLTIYCLTLFNSYAYLVMP